MISICIRNRQVHRVADYAMRPCMHREMHREMHRAMHRIEFTRNHVRRTILRLSSKFLPWSILLTAIHRRRRIIWVLTTREFRTEPDAFFPIGGTPSSSLSVLHTYESWITVGPFWEHPNTDSKITKYWIIRHVFIHSSHFLKLFNF